MYTLYRLKKVVDMQRENDIKKQFEEYVHSDEFKSLLVEAINQSDMNKKLNLIVLALCTHVQELKKSKICQEGL
jgi:trans-2-enoyl-CoA reductase